MKTEFDAVRPRAVFPEICHGSDLLFCYPSPRSCMKTRPILWLLMGAALALAWPARAQELPRVVINEIHCNPTNSKSYPTEFIELYNPLPNAVDLSGWAFTRGISYTFPPGTTLAAGGYLVVAESPALVERFFATTALGPWVGSLANEGETI